ncbi:MAG: hypothetical protein ACK45B_15965, partial [Limisphaerales bacterium]
MPLGKVPAPARAAVAECDKRSTQRITLGDQFGDGGVGRETVCGGSGGGGGALGEAAPCSEGAPALRRLDPLEQGAPQLRGAARRRPCGLCGLREALGLFLQPLEG